MQSWFADLNTRENIELRNRSKISIDKDAFVGLSNLRLLDLAENEISVLHQGMFEGLSKLSTLYLSRNQINKILSGTFNSLIALILKIIQKNIKIYLFFNKMYTKQIIN